MSNNYFILAGEASGDQLGAWYVQRFLSGHEQEIMAIGGAALQASGVSLYAHYDCLNVTGIVEIIRHLPRLMRVRRDIVNHLKEKQYQELIVIDFPGFNLLCIKKIKEQYPAIRVTYLAPPQLWCWGGWRIKKLKKYTDRVIVLYAFEQRYYRQKGLAVEFYGCPLYARFSHQSKKELAARDNAFYEKKNYIALLPGSRVHEINRFFPLFLQAAYPLLEKNKELMLIIPMPDNQALLQLVKNIAQLLLSDKKELRDRLLFVTDQEKKSSLLSQSIGALSKPGTVTLELALLGVPTLVAFKTSWLTYLIARLFVNVRFMSLPNLFANTTIFKEFIQKNCTLEELAQALEKLYSSYTTDTLSYRNNLATVIEFSKQFKKENLC